MTLDVTEAEAAAGLARVPVCIGCHRAATGRRAARLRVTRPGVTPGGGDDLLSAAVLVAAVAADVRGRAAAPAADVAYPTCWRHRWISRPALRLESAGDGRVRLGGVSPAFAAAWEAIRTPTREA